MFRIRWSANSALWWPGGLLGGLLALLTLLPFHQVGGFAFVNWDDPLYILDNPVVRQGLHWEGVRQIMATALPYPMPMAYLTFMLQVELFGLDGGAFHWVGVAGHLVNVWLLFAWVWRVTALPALAGLAAAWFAVHPLRVEAVVWISEQKEIGASLFGLLALHAHLSHVRQRAGGGKGAAYYFLALLCFLVSMLYKPQWVTLPVLLLLLDFWPLQRLHRGVVALVVEKLPYFAIAAGFSLLTLVSFAGLGRLSGIDTLPLSQRLANGVACVGGYVEKTLWPVQLSVYYPFTAGWQGLETALWLLALGAITLLCWQWRHQRPWWWVAWLWSLAALAPVSGLVTGGELVAMADRWSYLPHMLLFTALAREATLATPPLRWLLWAVPLAILPVLSWQQTAVWRDSGTLWRHAIDHPVSRHSFYPRIQLGKYHGERGEPQEALPLFQQARQMAPDNPLVALELANVLVALDRGPEAWPHFAAMTRLAAEPKIIANTGLAFLLNRQHEEARYFFSAALQRWPEKNDPHLVESRFHLALALEALGQQEEGARLLRDFLHFATPSPSQRCQLALQTFQNADFLLRYPHSARRLAHLCQPPPGK